MAEKPGSKPKADKGEAKAKTKAEKPAKAKAAQGEDAVQTAPAPPKVEEAPRAPSDPRLKVLKKFRGKFLPKGPLRERHRALMARWDSGEDHGGVTVEELKSLLDDWRGSRRKRERVVRG